MTEKKTTQVFPSIFKGLSKQEVDELAKCAPIESHNEHLLRTERLKQLSLGLLDDLRRDFVEARKHNRGCKLIIFLSQKFYDDLFWARNPYHGVLDEIENSGMLFGADLKIFLEPPMRNIKDRNCKGYYIHCMSPTVRR
ncbi:hypothetical protein C0J08_15065 [Marinomonas sp. CT5]|uniref:hypothetical protein n=1 Tax=Marinomonas sp. CT5 TaxID=2066133 RepID=UPI001BB0D522|nr:hypothetical protein [Marinomonas sp. CT5]QUX96638.1 hypothetical protein C0J08_15065 [Marinomonas sp. CT5]